MEYRTFGQTGIRVSVIGFGAWAIGGPAMAGLIPIGWGDTDDAASLAALRTAFDRGITFYDTADFYGLGRSEKLIGSVFANSDKVVIATKVGHRLNDDGSITLDYSKRHILSACEQSLLRLRRDAIDFYQMHSARIGHLEQGDCIAAMEQLQQEGKIRFWGLSLNTFTPEPECTWLRTHNLGHGFQLVLNIINQRSVPLLSELGKAGYGVIARMPLQFGLLTGKFTAENRFSADDHRSNRLPPHILGSAMNALESIWPLAEKYRVRASTLAFSYCASFPEVSTIIPGIRTSAQAEENARELVSLDKADKDLIASLFRERFVPLIDMMQTIG